MFTPKELALERGWPGRIDGDRVVQLAAQTLQSFFTGGGVAREHAEHALADVDLRPPVLHPPAVRDFMAFEAHVANARRAGGAEVPKEWYEIPVFYFSNPAAIYGPEEPVPYPDGTEELDYELECAAIIGADGQIGGFTVLNDWSARDLQRQEMRVGLGPAKGKDFATSIGPVLVTPDEFDGTAGAMVARINGEERSRGNLDDMYHTWDALLAHAARNTTLRPGDVIGSGTVGNGCILEHGRRPVAETWRRRRAGDRRDRNVEERGLVISADDVRAAARLLEGVAHRTPLVSSRTLGENVVLKPECLQRAGAFKFRGAYNKIASLPQGTPVLAYSSGNHAQAVALAARLLGTRATILMPTDAVAAEARCDPRLRRRRRHLRPVHGGSRGARRCARSRARPASSSGRTTIPLVMAGAGTAALELIEDGGWLRHARHAGRRRRVDLGQRNDRA